MYQARLFEENGLVWLVSHLEKEILMQVAMILDVMTKVIDVVW